MLKKLDKKSLKEIILNELTHNSLGYEFLEYNRRAYYFVRSSRSADEDNTMKINVHFKKGKIRCSLQSIVDFSLKNTTYIYTGLLNRQLFLKNALIDSTSFLEGVYYTFEDNEQSLKNTMQQILNDLNTHGRIFIEGCDSRFTDKRYIRAMEFINSLDIDRNILRKEFYDESAKADHSIPKNRNPVFCELVEELQNVEDGTFEIENHMIAFEFLHKYMFE